MNLSTPPGGFCVTAALKVRARASSTNLVELQSMAFMVEMRRQLRNGNKGLP